MATKNPNVKNPVPGRYRITVRAIDENALKTVLEYFHDRFDERFDPVGLEVAAAMDQEWTFGEYPKDLAETISMDIATSVSVRGGDGRFGIIPVL